MPAAAIHPAVPPPTMTTRNGCDPMRISEFGADTKLVAPVHPRPPRIPVNRSGARSCRGVAEYLLLIRDPGIQQVGYIERQLQVGAHRVAYRAVEESGGLLEYGQADAAIQILCEITGAPVVSET